ncbi:hypothetical protein GCM10023205_17950 [Yinghuangia aomiensis]|uniref:Uncharacterized protein n=1 Tax=Yinghuangia aomiensis TaxID=676205 RepID=A0ABP9GY52_9ACTN
MITDESADGVGTDFGASGIGRGAARPAEAVCGVISAAVVRPAAARAHQRERREDGGMGLGMPSMIREEI